MLVKGSLIESYADFVKQETDMIHDTELRFQNLLSEITGTPAIKIVREEEKFDDAEFSS